MIEEGALDVYFEEEIQILVDEDSDIDVERVAAVLGESEISYSQIRGSSM